MSELPADWEWSTLGAVCEKPQYGWTTSATDSGKIKLLRTTDLTHGPITWDTVPYCKDAPGSIDKFLVQPNDIFISRAGSVGVSVLVKDVPEKSVFASYLIRLRPTTQVDPRFLSLFLLSPGYWAQVSEMSSGIALANINATKIQSMKIPLPPIAEQHQIVEILEDHLSRLDAALADVKQAREKAALFRRSLLKAVFSNNYHSHQGFKNQSNRWGNPALEELLMPFKDGRLISQGWSPQCESEPATNNEEWGVLKTTAVQFGSFLPEYNKRLPVTLDPRPSLEVQEGDLIIMRAGPRVRCGVPCLVRVTRPRLMISDKMYRFRANEEKIDSRFLEHYLCSPEAQDLIEKMKTGISDSGVNLTQSRFMSMSIPLPSLRMQQEIVNKIEMNMSLMDTSLVSINVVEKEAKSLRRSLLHAAFTGQLIREGTSV